MNSLKRQASKAERFAAVRDELRGRLRVVLASRMALMDSDQARLGREIAALTERINASSAELRSRKAASIPSPSGATSWTARARRRRIAPIPRLSSWSGPRRGARNTERVAELETRIAAAGAELEQTRTS